MKKNIGNINRLTINLFNWTNNIRQLKNKIKILKFKIKN
jgi:hypothetical protein